MASLCSFYVKFGAMAMILRKYTSRKLASHTHALRALRLHWYCTFVFVRSMPCSHKAHLPVMPYYRHGCIIAPLSARTSVLYARSIENLACARRIFTNTHGHGIVVQDQICQFLRVACMSKELSLHGVCRAVVAFLCMSGITGSNPFFFISSDLSFATH